MPPLKARLLVASPRLTDGQFDRTVVYLIEHSPDGALGVVINRPTGLDVADPLPAWERFTGTPGVVFAGGPVSTSSVLALAWATDALPAGTFEVVEGRVGVLDLTHDADELGPGLGGLRIFAGYAGWGPGQLESEIEQGAWYVVDARPDDPFSTEPEDLWRSVLARQPGALKAVARVPEDLSVN